jgi:hypothetical protein
VVCFWHRSSSFLRLFTTSYDFQGSDIFFPEFRRFIKELEVWTKTLLFRESGTVLLACFAYTRLFRRKRNIRRHAKIKYSQADVAAPDSGSQVRRRQHLQKTGASVLSRLSAAVGKSLHFSICAALFTLLDLYNMGQFQLHDEPGTRRRHPGERGPLQATPSPGPLARLCQQLDSFLRISMTFPDFPTITTKSQDLD